MATCPPPEELIKIAYTTPVTSWMDTKTPFKPGNFSYPGKPEILKYLGMPNPRVWSPTDDDWQLPPDWQRLVMEKFRSLLKKYRSFKVFMDICVRCGACADKCHFFIGGGDPKNMPVLRAELLRSIYRGEFSAAAKVLGKLAGARKLEEDVIKEWFLYFYQCTECRRCSLFCPYGIDTAEITMMARELLHEVGCNINWILEPAANCNRTGNHLGIQPHAYKDMMDFLCDDIEEITGKRIRPNVNKKGCEILFITPSGDIFADPGIYTYMGYLILFEHLGLGRGLTALGRDQGEAGAEAVERDHDLQARIHAVRDLDRRHRLARVVARDELLDRLGADLQVGVVGGGQAVAQPQRVDARKLRIGRQAHAQRPAGLVEEQPQVRSGGQVVFHAFSPLA